MSTVDFYDDLAGHYHLIFEDWGRSIQRQAAILGPLLEREQELEQGAERPALRILDCACGIGTQSLGLAERGHRVTGSDFSSAAITRARREAQLMNVKADFHIADMRDLSSIPPAPGSIDKAFDAIMAADNSLPHLLLKEDRDRALQQMAGKLKPGGILLLTLRDYDRLVRERPTVQPPSFFGPRGRRRIVHQVWDWDETEYDAHLHIALQAPQGWTAMHYVTRYHALVREDLNDSLRKVDLIDIRWLEPAATSFYQPIVMAIKP